MAVNRAHPTLLWRPEYRFSQIRCKPPPLPPGLNLRMERILSEAAPPAELNPSGAPDDFDAVVRQHRPRVFRFILASLRDRESAENLTQDCFVRAYQARHQFRGDASIGTWLMQIAANLVRNHEASGRLRFWRRTLAPDMDLSAAGDWIPSQEMSPEEIAMAKQRVESIWRVAAKLSEKQRTVFLLRFVEDMDILEICAVTGMKEGTVKTHLFRALKAVRAAIEEKK